MIVKKKERLIFCLLFLYGLWAFTVHAEKIVLAADNWCPYNCEQASEKQGYVLEIAKQVFTGRGHTIEYKIMPWTRAIEEARAGSMDAIIGAMKDDAPDFIFPENEVGMSGNMFFTLKENDWTYKDTVSLQGISLGIINDYAYTEPLDTYIKHHKNNIKKIQAASGESALTTNIQKLKGGRIDVLVEDPAVFQYTIDRMGLKQNIKSAGCLREEKIYIAFSPVLSKSKEHAKTLSEGIEALRKSGALKKILDGYGLADWKKSY